MLRDRLARMQRWTKGRGDGGGARPVRPGAGGREQQLAGLALQAVAGEVQQQEVVGPALGEEVLDPAGDDVGRLVVHRPRPFLGPAVPAHEQLGQRVLLGARGAGELQHATVHLDPHGPRRAAARRPDHVRHVQLAQFVAQVADERVGPLGAGTVLGDANGQLVRHATSVDPRRGGTGRQADIRLSGRPAPGGTRGTPRSSVCR